MPQRPLGLVSTLAADVSYQHGTAKPRPTLHSGMPLPYSSQLERLQAIVQQARGFGLVVDGSSSPGLRPARVWVAVGPDGIPEQMEVEGEYSDASILSLGSTAERVPITPDLEGFRSKGWMVMTREEFQGVAEVLRKQVEGSSRPLPYTPSARSVAEYCSCDRRDPSSRHDRMEEGG